MDTQDIYKKYQALLARFGVPLRIVTTDDPEKPRQEIIENADGFILRLNPSKFSPSVSCESYIAHNARSVLLPRLVLETERLVLRRFQSEDAEDCFSFLSDRQSCYDDGGYAPYSEMNEDFFQLMETFAGQETRYMIVLKSTGRVIGTIHLWNDDSRAVEAMELGYCIAPSHRRKGYAFEAVSALIHLLQEDLKLELLLAGAFPDNTASLHLLNKLDFVQEGILHKALWHCERGAVDIVHFYRER